MTTITFYPQNTNHKIRQKTPLDIPCSFPRLRHKLLSILLSHSNHKLVNTHRTKSVNPATKGKYASYKLASAQQRFADGGRRRGPGGWSKETHNGYFPAKEVFDFACFDGIGTLIGNQLVQVYC